jgi:hypothetical protein
MNQEELHRRGAENRMTLIALLNAERLADTGAAIERKREEDGAQR